MYKKTVKKQDKYCTHEEQYAIIQEMISNGCTKKEIWKKNRPGRKTWTAPQVDI